jgi:hypothetical protein
MGLPERAELSVHFTEEVNGQAEREVFRQILIT